MSRYWLGVVCADHVANGIELGIAQANHGKPQALRKMQSGDGLIYYSPRSSLRNGTQLQAFTAVGWIAEGEPWQHGVDDSTEQNGFKPWRRRVQYLPAALVPLAQLKSQLELTQPANWRYQLRRGMLELSESDFQLIHDAMMVK